MSIPTTLSSNHLRFYQDDLSSPSSSEIICSFGQTLEEEEKKSRKIQENDVEGEEECPSPTKPRRKKNRKQSLFSSYNNNTKNETSAENSHQNSNEKQHPVSCLKSVSKYQRVPSIEKISSLDSEFNQNGSQLTAISNNCDYLKKQGFFTDNFRTSVQFEESSTKDECNNSKHESEDLQQKKENNCDSSSYTFEKCNVEKAQMMPIENRIIAWLEEQNIKQVSPSKNEDYFQGRKSEIFYRLSSDEYQEKDKKDNDNDSISDFLSLTSAPTILLKRRSNKKSLQKINTCHFIN